MRLKGLKVVRKADGFFVVTPLYYSKRGGSRPDNYQARGGESALKVVGEVLADLVLEGVLSR
jgi:hypothetical protein